MRERRRHSSAHSSQRSARSKAFDIGGTSQNEWWRARRFTGDGPDGPLGLLARESRDAAAVLVTRQNDKSSKKARSASRRFCNPCPCAALGWPPPLAHHAPSSERWLHDLRRTARSLMSQARIDPDHEECALGAHDRHAWGKSDKRSRLWLHGSTTYYGRCGGRRRVSLELARNFRRGMGRVS